MMLIRQKEVCFPLPEGISFFTINYRISFFHWIVQKSRSNRQFCGQIRKTFENNNNIYWNTSMASPSVSITIDSGALRHLTNL